MDRKKALITGASRGIGKAIAFAMAEADYDLYLTAFHNSGMLGQVKTEIQNKYNVKAEAFLCDAADAADVAALFRRIPCLDVLINNAGQAYSGLLTDMTIEAWQRLIDVNLSSVFYTCREAIPAMVARKAGKIINVSSLWGEVGASLEVAYSASKAGVSGFTKALAKELAPSNIQVNAIAPGLVDTDMNQNLSRAEWDEFCATIPAGRSGSAAEVAAMVLQLVNAPTYFTGQVVRIDGGA
jgi:3-oxoacyl-[acyl-carrier protein] reductase